MKATPSNKQYDFTIPQRQSAAAIIILMLRSAITIGKSLWPALLVILFNTKRQNESNKVFIILIGFVALTLFITLIRYWFYHFFIQHDNLVIKTGWLKKKTLSIPLQSIQAVHLEQNLWQQAFGVAKISFDSAGSEKVEARIDALAMTKAEHLKQILLSKTRIQTELESTFHHAPTVYKLSPKDLLKLSLSANHLEAFFLLLALSINVIDDLRKAFNIDEWKWMQSLTNSLKGEVIFATTIIIVFVAIVSIAYSMLRTIFRYFNFTMQDTHNAWKLTFGLINRQENIIPHSKIQVFSWHSNWLRRKLNFWMIDVQTIGHLSRKEKQRTKIPLTESRSAVMLASVYQSTEVFNPSSGNRIDAGYWKRKTLLVGVPVTLAVVAISWYWLGGDSAWVSLLLVYFTGYFYKWYTHYRWFVNEEGIQAYSGVWGRRYSLLVWKKVQQIKISQSPYQRSHQLATITFQTAGGNIVLPYISLAIAQQLSNFVLFQVEYKNEKWM
jgi:putative membrane protein